MLLGVEVSKPHLNPTPRWPTGITPSAPSKLHRASRALSKGATGRSVPDGETVSNNRAPGSRARPSRSGLRPSRQSGVTAARREPPASGRSEWHCPSRSRDGRACRIHPPATASVDRTRSRWSHVTSARRCSRTSWSCDSGAVRFQHA